MNSRVIAAILFIFASSCGNVLLLDSLLQIDPAAGNLITFLQFAFIALIGLLCTSKFFTTKRHLPIWDYVLLVTMYFVSSVCKNYAFDFKLPMSLHIAFRSATLIIQLLMAAYLKKRRYSVAKYVSVLLITVGVCACTIMSGYALQPKAFAISGDDMHHDAPSKWYQSYSDDYSLDIWSPIGIGLLTVGLLLTARMGLHQELLYKRHGKHPYELMFYMHMLPLPLFLGIYPNISEHVAIFTATEGIAMPYTEFAIPMAWFYLLASVATQYIGIRSLYVLTSEYSALTVTMIVSLRKFIALVCAIAYFANAFTLYYWIATAMVALGAILFTDWCSARKTDPYKSTRLLNKSYESRKMI